MRLLPPQQPPTLGPYPSRSSSHLFFSCATFQIYTQKRGTPRSPSLPHMYFFTSCQTFVHTEILKSVTLENNVPLCIPPMRPSQVRLDYAHACFRYALRSPSAFYCAIRQVLKLHTCHMFCYSLFLVNIIILRNVHLIDGIS